jgi:hypothetical protein
MPLPQALAQQFEDALVALGADRRSTPLPSAPGKALELWLLMMVAEAFDARPGWSAALCDGAGNPLAPSTAFETRAQPGRIAAKNASAPGFVRLSGPGGKAFELHGSLQFIGRSRGRHEIDLSLIPAAIGAAIRSSPRGGRPSGMPVAGIECKHHVSDGSIGEMREKVARLFDLTFLGRAQPANPYLLFWPLVRTPAAGWGQRPTGPGTAYRTVFGGGVYGIARSTDFPTGAILLSNFHAVRRFPNIYDPAVLQRLVDDLFAAADAA